MQTRGQYENDTATTATARTHPTGTLPRKHRHHLSFPNLHLGIQLGFEIIHGLIHSGDKLAHGPIRSIIVKLVVPERVELAHRAQVVVGFFTRVELGIVFRGEVGLV